MINREIQSNIAKTLINKFGERPCNWYQFTGNLMKRKVLRIGKLEPDEEIILKCIENLTPEAEKKVRSLMYNQLEVTKYLCTVIVNNSHELRAARERKKHDEDLKAIENMVDVPEKTVSMPEWKIKANERLEKLKAQFKKSTDSNIKRLLSQEIRNIENRLGGIM